MLNSLLGLGPENLRKLELRGRVRLLPILDFGLRLGGRTPRRASKSTLSTLRFSGSGYQGGLRKGLREHEGRLRWGLTGFEGLR